MTTPCHAAPYATVGSMLDAELCARSQYQNSHGAWVEHLSQPDLVTKAESDVDGGPACSGGGSDSSTASRYPLSACGRTDPDTAKANPRDLGVSAVITRTRGKQQNASFAGELDRKPVGTIGTRVAWTTNAELADAAPRRLRDVGRGKVPEADGWSLEPPCSVRRSALLPAKRHAPALRWARRDSWTACSWPAGPRREAGGPGRQPTPRAARAARNPSRQH